MEPIVGQVSLVIYAILLVAGGYIAYAKKRSRVSLIAGGLSGVLELACVVGSVLFDVTVGLGGGALLAALLTFFFAFRYVKTQKLMPSGMMAVVSLIVVVLVLLVAVFSGGGPVES